MDKVSKLGFSKKYRMNNIKNIDLLKIRKDYNEILNLEEVARLNSIPIHKARIICDEILVRRNFSHIDEMRTKSDKIMDDYRNGNTLEELTIKYDVSLFIIKSILTKYNDYSFIANKHKGVKTLKTKHIDENNNLLCVKCNVYLPSENFYTGSKKINLDYREGKSIECKKCHYKRRQVEYFEAEQNKDKYVGRLVSCVKSRILNGAKKKKGFKFEIDKEFVLSLLLKQGGKCALTGELMTFYVGQRGWVNTNLSIDRIDGTKGYTKDNIQLTTAQANRLRGELTLSELVTFCKNILNTIDKNG